MFGINGFEKEIQRLGALKQARSLELETQEKIKRAVFSEINNPQSVFTPELKANFWHLRVTQFAFSFIALFFVIGGTVFASNKTAPGDALYPVKKLKETVEIKLAPTEIIKANLELKYAKERIKELKEIESREPAGQQSGLINPQTQDTVATASPIQLELGKNTSNKNEKIKKEASRQVNKALEALAREKAKSENKGRKQDAEKLREKMEDLTNSARQESLRFTQPESSDAGGEDAGEVKGENTIKNLPLWQNRRNASERRGLKKPEIKVPETEQKNPEANVQDSEKLKTEDNSDSAENSQNSQTKD